MKLNIGKCELEMQQITQLCGTDFEKKAFIIESLYKYFSGHKYAVYEEDYVDNIRIDNGEVGRKYFDVVRIENVNDIINELKISKSSAIMQWLNVQIDNIECRTKLEEISYLLDEIYEKLNCSILEKSMGLRIGYEQKNMLEILQKSMVMPEKEEFLENRKSGELLISYIRLLQELQNYNPHKQMVIIENIDHLIGREEYEHLFELIKEIISTKDIWFVLSSSIDGYVYVEREYLEGINVINDEIFNLPDYQHLYTYISENYPCQYIPDEKELFQKLKMIVHKIGDGSWKSDFKSQVYLKLFNATLGIKNAEKKYVNQLEIAFLCD